MTAIALIPGAGGLGWCWHLVERGLRDRGFDAFAVDLAAYGHTGLPAYADAVVDAIGDRAEVALVAHSMGAFTAPSVWQRVSISAVVFLNAMIPRPGETPGEWWDDVGSEEARTGAARRDGYSPQFDRATYFTHDLDGALLAELKRRGPSQLDERFDDICAFDEWPAIPRHAIAGRDDRFFPHELQQRLARERLGVEAVTVPGGHLAALSHPAEVSIAIAECLRDL